MSERTERLVVYFIAAAAYCFLIFYMPYKYKDLPASLSRTVTVIIPSGVSAREAARIIEDAGVVGDASALARAMSDLGIDRRLRPGLYNLHPSTPVSAARQLAESRPIVNKVTLIPGFKYRQISAVFGSTPEGRSFFAEAVKNDDNFTPDMRTWLPSEAEARVVFLLPETYFIAPGPRAADDFVKAASRLWYERVGSRIPVKASPDSVMKEAVLASLVEAESLTGKESPILAGIFLNRLSKRMRLQSDATVVYAWDEKGVRKDKLSYSDLKIKSPFNTYLVNGLPPAPICVPSESSWKSALSPQKSDYLFFFTDKDGRFIYSKTYSEHLANQRKHGL